MYVPQTQKYINIIRL